MSAKPVTFVCVLTAITLAGALHSGAWAAKSRKPAPKPKRPAPRVLLGTKQLSGDQAVPGTEYTLGKTQPLNFQLDSAEFSTGRITIGDASHIPSADEKYLVLHFTVHNPQNSEQLARYDTFDFTAVDSQNTNREGSGIWGNASNQQHLDMNLKPGQKVSAYTFIVVPADATIPKLIVKASDGPVLRYDLKDKIKPLTPPFCTPSDATTALKVVPAQQGTWYQCGDMDLRVDGMTFSTTPIEEQEFAEGERNLIIGATVRCGIPGTALMRYDTFQFTISDQDGAEIPWMNKVLKGSRDEEFDAQIPFGKEIKVRFPAVVSKGTEVKSLVISAGEEFRAYSFDTSALH